VDEEPIDISKLREDDEKVDMLAKGEPVDDDELTLLIKAWIKGLGT
jgi:hypothetical protein